MNLTELRNKVKAITDYSPDLAVYNEQMDGLINDAMYALWTEKRWTFSSKQTFIDIYPDIVPLQISGTLSSATTVNNSRKITFSTPVHSLDLQQQLEGQIFEIQGRDYKILKVVNSQEIRLEVPFRGIAHAGDTTWKIKHRFYDLPNDAVEILYLGHRDAPIARSTFAGKVVGIPPRLEESLNLQEDLTNNYSECYIPTPPANIPPGEKFNYISEDVEGEQDPFGDLPANSYLELCWCFEGDGGKCGPLSIPIVCKVTGSGLTLTLYFTTFDDVNVAAAAFNPNVDQVVNQFEGLRKRIFFNQNFNRVTGIRLSGLPVWRDVTIGSTFVAPGMPGKDTSEDPVRVDDEVGFYFLQFLDQVNPGNKRFIDYDGSHPRFRPYPRPNSGDQNYQFVVGVTVPATISAASERSFRQWECRYLYKPNLLALQTDQPQLPHEFHNLIVYKALHDIFSKHDNLAQAGNYQRKYEEEIKRLSARYVTSIDTAYIRGQFGLTDNSHSFYDSGSFRKLN